MPILRVKWIFFYPRYIACLENYTVMLKIHFPIDDPEKLLFAVNIKQCKGNNSDDGWGAPQKCFWQSENEAHDFESIMCGL